MKQELASRGVVVEEYGGKVVAAEISAKKGTNVDRLLDLILLQADLLELKADPDFAGKGFGLCRRVRRARHRPHRQPEDHRDADEEQRRQRKSDRAECDNECCECAHAPRTGRLLPRSDC